MLMITKEQAIALGSETLRDEIHCELVSRCEKIVGRRGDVTQRIERCRPNGQCKTWDTSSEEFRLPVKFAAYQHGYITEHTAAYFHLAENCPINLGELSCAKGSDIYR